MGDFNSEYENLTTWMLELGSQDLIVQKYRQGPKTHDCLKDSFIDCIFDSASLKVSE